MDTLIPKGEKNPFKDDLGSQGGNQGEALTGETESPKEITSEEGIVSVSGSEVLSIQKAFSFAWKIWRARPFYITLMPVVITFCFIMLAIPIMLVPIIFTSAFLIFLQNLIASGILGVLLALLGVLFALTIFGLTFFVMMFGMVFQYKFFINIVTGENKSVGDILKSLKDFSLVWRLFVALGVYSLIVFFGTLLFIVPGIIWGIKYTFVPWLILDKKLGIRDAFRKSAEMTYGRKMELFVFWLVISLLLFISSLIIGNLLVTPFYLIICIYVYLLFMGEEARLTKPGKSYSLLAVVLIILLGVVFNVIGMINDFSRVNSLEMDNVNTARVEDF